MQKSEVRPLYRCCCCRYSGSRESEPLFLAVYKNDLNDLKSLISCGQSANVKSVRGNTLLNYVIERGSMDIFDWLLSLEGFDLDREDSYGRSPLLHAVANSAEASFALKLIDGGADVCRRDHRGLTVLHLAARHSTVDSLTVARAVIDKGAVVDALSSEGESPLYVACREGNVDFVHMLLYFGADATVACDGVLPLVAVSQQLDLEEQVQLQEVLFDYTFDGDVNSVPLATVVKAMTLDTLLFERIVDPTPEVTYDESDLKYLSDNLLYVKVDRLRLFMKKFAKITQELIENFPLLTLWFVLTSRSDVSKVMDLICAFLESDFAFDFVQTADPTHCNISRLLDTVSLVDVAAEEETVTKMTCVMLSHGLNVFSEDLDTVYGRYGHCQLFKILLHMDIVKKEVSWNTAAIYYNPTTDVEVLCNIVSLNWNILTYFSHAKLKERCLRELHGDVVARMKLLPTVPYLVELSRNEARKYIINKYNVGNSMQFYTILKWLPIAEVCKRIIAFEMRVYRI